MKTFDDKGNRRGPVDPGSKIRFLAAFPIVLIGLGFGLALLYPELGWPGAMRASLGLFFVLFLPGFAARRLFYERGALDRVEAAGVSVGLSIAVVIVTFLFTNLVLKIPVTAGINFFILLTVTICLYGAGLVRARKGRR